MIAWLGKNKWSLVAIAILGPLAMIAAMSTDWFAYQERVNGHPVTVAEGEAIDFAGASWTLDQSFVVPAESQEGRSIDLVEGTELVVASVRVNPSGVGGVAPPCTIKLADRDNKRTWDQALSSDVDVALDPGATSYCDSTNLDSYLLQVIFVVPEGAGDGARLLIGSNAELPRTLSFVL